MVGTILNQPGVSFDAAAAVNSIQSSTAEAIAAQRKHRRFDIRLKVVVQPANTVDRVDIKWLGECHDISSGGCRVLTQRPLELGSLYWIQFEPGKITIDPVFGRCVRGHLLRENAFEFGMCFLTPIEVPEPAQEAEVSAMLL